MAASAAVATLTAAQFMARIDELVEQGDTAALLRYCGEHASEVRPLLTEEQWAGLLGVSEWATNIERWKAI